MTNKYLEKIAGISVSGIKSAVGKYAKNLTGETVRETKKALDVTSSIKSEWATSESAHQAYGKQLSEAMKNGSKKEKESISERMSDHFRDRRHNINGMGSMEDAVKKHIPPTTESDLASAIKSRNNTRIGTASFAGGALLGGVAAKKGVEKKAGLTSRILSGAALGAGAGAIAGGEDHRVSGALGGAAIGAGAGALGGKMLGNKPKQLTDGIVHKMQGAQLVDSVGKAINAPKLK